MVKPRAAFVDGSKQAVIVSFVDAQRKEFVTFTSLERPLTDAELTQSLTACYSDMLKKGYNAAAK